MKLKTLKAKLSLLYTVLVFLIALVGFFAGTSIFRIEKSVDGLLDDNYRSIQACAKMTEAIERQDSAIYIYLSIDESRGISQFNSNSAEFLKWYNLESENITEKKEGEAVANLHKDYLKYVNEFSQLQELKNKKDSKSALLYYQSKTSRVFFDVKKDIQLISDINEKAMFNSKEKVIRNAHDSFNTMLIISFLAMVTGYILSRYFVNLFLKPLQVLSKSLNLIKAGNLDYQIEVESSDEIGQLSLEFNNMTARLLEYEKSNIGKLIVEKNKSMAILRSIPDPMMVIDKNYRIMLSNSACEDFFGFKDNSYMGKHFLEVIRNGNIFEHINSTFLNEEDFEEKIFLIEKNKNLVYFNVIITKMRGIDEVPEGAIVVFQNVTHLKQIEKLKTDFITTISHEFKTPLTSITMGTSLLLENSIGDISKSQREIIEAIRDDGDRLSNLVTNLINLSKIESEKAVFNKKKISLNSIIELSLNNFYELASYKNIKIENIAEKSKIYVYADIEKMAWVMNNLISNAIKFTSNGGRIIVKTWKDGKSINISVKDTGVGIPEEYIEKIFDKFVQVKSSVENSAGSGLGLSIAKQIVIAHNGKILCKSEVGVGSEFIITLPIIEEE